MNIGDLFFGFRGEDSGLMLDAKKSGAKAGSTAGTSFSSKFGESMKGGLGIGAGIGAFSLLSGAVAKTTEYLTDAVAMAKEEEVGIGRLTASLAANVPGWNGSTDAIEKNIGAMVRSTGFSDGDMRDSLAKLVASTHNVDEAFRIQATAMDLARFKGISLVDASTALIKVEGGQYRALKELGIVLKKGATSTEALAAVQKVAGGQMAAYMDTAAGKTEVLNNRLEDMQEELGSKLTGPLTTATGLMLTFMDAVDSDAPLTFTERLKGIGDMANTINPMMWASNIGLGIVGDSAEDAADKLAAAAAEGAEAWDTGSERIGSALGRVVTASGDTVAEVIADTAKWKEANRSVVLSYGTIASYLLGKYNDDFNTAMGIQEARADLHNAKTDVDKAAAYASLAELGALSKKDYSAWLAALERLAATTKGKVHAAYVAAIADIKALRASSRDPINVTVNYRKPGQPSGGYGGQAAGGPYGAGQAFWVGEKGPELRVESAPGYTLNHQDSMAAVMGGGQSGDLHVHIEGVSILTPGAAEALARQVAPHVTHWQQGRQILPRR